MATFIVTNTNKIGLESLADAINRANAGNDFDEIIFDPSLSGQTIYAGIGSGSPD